MSEPTKAEQWWESYERNHATMRDAKAFRRTAVDAFAAGQAENEADHETARQAHALEVRLEVLAKELARVVAKSSKGLEFTR